MLTEQLTWQDESGTWFTPRMAVLNALIDAGMGDAIPNGSRGNNRFTSVRHQRLVRAHAVEIRREPKPAAPKPTVPKPAELKPQGRKRPKPWNRLQTRPQRLEYIWGVLGEKAEEKCD